MKFGIPTIKYTTASLITALAALPLVSCKPSESDLQGTYTCEQVAQELTLSEKGKCFQKGIIGAMPCTWVLDGEQIIIQISFPGSTPDIGKVLSSDQISYDNCIYIRKGE